jgi:hypothetical protein
MKIINGFSYSGQAGRRYGEGGGGGVFDMVITLLDVEHAVWDPN